MRERCDRANPRPWDVRRKVRVGDLVEHREWRVRSHVLRTGSYGNPQCPVYLIQTSHNVQAWVRRDAIQRVYWSDADNGALVSVEPPEKET